MTTTSRLVLFTVGGSDYAMDAAFVQSITRAGSIQVESDGNGRFGWLTARSGRRPVYDVAHFLHLPPTPAERPGPGLVLESMLGSVLMVQRINRVENVSPEQLTPLPLAALGPSGHLLTGMYASGDVMIPILRPDIHSAGKITPADLEKLRAPKLAGASHGGSGLSGLVSFSTDRANGTGYSVRFGIPLTALREVLEPLALIPLHLPGSYFGGFIPWRGRPVPVLDLNRRLELERLQPSEQNRFLILRTDQPGQFFAVAANSDIRIHHDLSEASDSEERPALNDYFVAGVYRFQGAFLVIPDLMRIAFAEDSPVA